ncbi:hypothetical protein RchiOBHm_Chr2g0147121 [Rosa chinensis]|uniref:Uncharacterized protein n=1 Tax=Rosa chinensis TaxID=74649 RepID=A0A2P6RZ20_ROSCH|nr:hypothetical protein RchiOBHm_Chr2g0147121 [Rosa chinensis]
MIPIPNPPVAQSIDLSTTPSVSLSLEPSDSHPLPLILLVQTGKPLSLIR